jgi:carboxymethylenebutenolidase
MIEQHLNIPTADGSMNSFVVQPEEGGPFPVVLFYMDAPGKREELHQMARRLAAVGYCVVLPNLYYRQSPDFWLSERTAPAMARMFELMGTLDAATTACDTRALLDFVDTLPGADATRVAALGYCMSGPFVVWAAAAFPDRFRCIASIHGANMATNQPDSPHRAVLKVHCESYFACAEIDKWAPPPDRVWNMGSCFRCARASTTKQQPSGIGNGCSACLSAPWVEGVLMGKLLRICCHVVVRRVDLEFGRRQ